DSCIQPFSRSTVSWKDTKGPTALTSVCLSVHRIPYMTVKEVPGHVNVLGHDQGKQEFTVSISTVQRDITTPIPTIPNLIPTTPTISTSPFLNPNSNPDTVSPPSTFPFTTPTTVNSPLSSGASWCIASPTASQTTLQVALDYACGYGGADCSAIQPGGSCYNPNSIRDHASYAFNKYYQKNPVPNSCNFGGTAVIISTNPSKPFAAMTLLVNSFNHVTCISILKQDLRYWGMSISIY
ncbi:hypothetical protein V8G54_035210, partial [Vigna mungo]